MKKYIAAIVLSLFLSVNAFSQKELGEYSFVVVPDTYSFLRENDQYQLNSLTKFLFNKHGFNAYFGQELPDVGRCDGLWADVEIDPGFIWTKMVVVLKDCNNTEVFRSFEGRSKKKEYKKSYYEALRSAFESIAAQGVQQPDPLVFTSGSDTKKDVVDQETTVDEEISEEIKNTEVALTELVNKTTSYVSNGSPFLLMETSDGYSLYEGSQGAELKLKGNLTLTSDKRLEFKDATGNIFNASFDADKNLIIETGFQKVRFTLVD